MLYKKFRSGNYDVQEKERSGRSSLEVYDKLTWILESNPQQSATKMALDLNMHHSTVCRHLRDMGMSLKLDKWVPHQLSEKQKMKRMTICSSRKIRLQKERFLKDILTCDENWIEYSNPNQGKH